MTFTWGASTLLEVSQFSATQGGELPLSRDGTFSSEGGTVEIFSFSTATVPSSDYGVRRRLRIVAPAGASTALLFDRDCVLQGRTAEAEANDAVRFAYTLRVMSTTGA
jgi:hypothetical protein